MISGFELRISSFNSGLMTPFGALIDKLSSLSDNLTPSDLSSARRFNALRAMQSNRTKAKRTFPRLLRGT
jgi:hypothetical protein